MQAKIIEFIRRNRVSTTEVADCMGKTGEVKGAKALNSGMFAVGPVKWVYAYEESNWPLHEQLRDIKEGEIALVEMFDCGDRAAFGELVAKYCVLYQGCAAIVCTGPMRDANDLIKNKYPVWCNGVTPIGTFNTKPTKAFPEDVLQERKAMYDGAIAVCDDSGVVVIPPHMVTEEFLKKLEFIEEQEDIWFDLLDRKKWDTYDIVCLKKYLQK
ncbi:MAG: RraA family protein [Eubacteriales bacterium]|nr:RraA family protein [Eubacteriales bacterium]